MNKLFFILSFFIVLVFSGKLHAQATLIHGTGDVGRYDIVFLGDGFTAAQQETYNGRVQSAVDRLFGTDVYSEFRGAFNVWRINVVSAESGIDHPRESIFRNTALNLSYGNPASGEIERCIRSNTPGEVRRVADAAPGRDMIMVLANDTMHGGCAFRMEGYTTSSITPGFEQTVAHELGHAIAHLNDEYTDDGTGGYTGSEDALSVNCTSRISPLKWNDLVTAGTPVPTPDTAIHSSHVGAFEGCNQSFPTGIWRPQHTCKMRESIQSFCAVCAREMRRILAGFVRNSPPTANAGPDQSHGIGETITLNGAASTDPDGDALTYSWSQVAGAPVILSSATSATPTFTMPLCFDAGTTFTFELTVRDSSGASASDRVDIRVSDSDPDHDGLINSRECALGANPRDPDTDRDGIRDGPEADGTWMGAYMCPTNPNGRDSDGDTLSDGDEINRYHTNPCNRNTDEDCDNDNIEVGMPGRNPTVREMAEIQVTPNMLIFNDVNRRGKLMNVQVRNIGTLPLQISRFATEGMGFSASSMPVTLAVGATQALQVLFSPQVAGPVTGSLQFESNDCQHNPFTVSMAANGQVSRLGVTEENLDFFHVPIRTLARQVIHLSNPDSNRPLKATLITEDPAFYPARPVQQIAPGATVEMAIYFKPYRYGNFESKVKIRGFYAQENQLKEVMLRGFGEGEAPVMASTPERIDFPATSVGVQDFKEIRIRNLGRGSLYIHRVEVIGMDGNPLDAELPIERRRVLPMLERFTVAGLGERTMRVRFQPTASGELRGELKIYHNGAAPGVLIIPFVARGR